MYMSKHTVSVMKRARLNLTQKRFKQTILSENYNTFTHTFIPIWSIDSERLKPGRRGFFYSSRYSRKIHGRIVSEKGNSTDQMRCVYKLGNTCTM